MVAIREARVIEQSAGTAADTAPSPIASAGLPDVADLAAERTRRALELVPSGRDHLELLRATYLDRLHHRSDDFEATNQLRVVEAALRMIPRSAGAWAWLQREQDRRPRRSLRRRRRRSTRARAELLSQRTAKGRRHP